MPESQEQRDNAVVSSADEPGPLSRLLQELADASGEDALENWKNELQPGDRVGRFEIRREVGRGGFGAVYEAFDTQLNRVVAVKTLRLSRPRRDLSTDWIKKEAEAVARLDHPCIVTLFDVGTCDSGPYLVMELLRGKTLAKRIAEGPVPLAEALRIAEEMAKGLAHAHQRGVLHRDLKPANVFLCEDGRVKLLDFGLAHLLGTEGVSGAGTPAYMAPEQAARQVVDERADVYAAGMVLGEMLTGKRPVERTPSPSLGLAVAEDGTEQMSGSPPTGSQPSTVSRSKLGGVPRAIGKAIAASVSEDLEARPRNGAAWLAELHSARRVIDRPRRIRRVTTFATAFIVVGLAVAGFATWRVWERQIPGGRPTVAVADFTNETGEKELDSISGLLITSLEQGTQLRVLTRGRMVDVLKQLGKGSVERIDEPLAREVGRETRAQALLLASIRKLGDAYVVEMRALDPLHDEYIFTVSDRATGKGAVFDLVDRLGAATRKRLGSPDAAAPQPPKVASITTDNPKAWALLFQARQVARDRTDHSEARRLAEEAAKEDPDFALAYLELARQAFWHEWKPLGPGAPGLKELEAAEARADRLPEKERLILRIFRALVDRRIDDAVRLSEESVAAYPLDKEVLMQAGDVLYHWEVDMGKAVQYFERALQLDPGDYTATAHLLYTVWWSGQSARFLPFIEQRATAVVQYDEAQVIGSPAAWAKVNELFILGVGLLAAGKEPEGVDLLKRADRITGTQGAPGGTDKFWDTYLCYQGRMAEAEAEVRAAFAQLESKGKKPMRFLLYHVLLASGRIREAHAVWENPKVKPGPPPFVSTDIALLKGSVEEVEVAWNRSEEKGASVEWNFETASAPQILGAAFGYVVLGDRTRARERILRAKSTPDWSVSVLDSHRRQGEAILAWSEGRMEDADRIIAENIRESFPPHQFVALQLAGWFHFTSGDCPGAVKYLEEARAVPWPSQPWSRSYDLPRMLHGLATCYETMGDLPKARERNAEMLKRWEKADEDIPLLVEAKEMRERLAVR